MSETLRIDVELPTQQAAQNAAQLAADLKTVGAAAATASPQVGQLATSAEKAGKSAQVAGTEAKTAGQAVVTAGQQVAAAAKEADKATEAVKAAGGAARDASGKFTSAGKAAADAGGNAQKATGQLDAHVAAWKGVGVSADLAAIKLKNAGGAAVDAGTKVADAAKTGGAETDKAKRKTDLWASATKKVGDEAKAMILGWAGITGILALMQKFIDQLQEVEEIRKRMIKDKEPLEQTISGFQANLGLSKTAGGRQQAIDLIRQFKADTPQASLPQITGIAGQLQAFQYDVTKPEGRDLVKLLSGFAASMGLGGEESEALPLMMRSLGVKGTGDAQQRLAQILEGQKNTGIANQSDYVKQFIRLGAPFINRGMKIEDVGGVLAGSAGGAVDARIVGTNAEQAMRVVMGKDTDARSALGRVAAGQGLIDPLALDEETGKREAALGGAHAAEILKNQREIGDLDEKRQRLKAAYDRRIATMDAADAKDRREIAEAQAIADKPTGTTAAARAKSGQSARDRITDLTAALDRRAGERSGDATTYEDQVRDLGQNQADRRERIAGIRGEVATKAQAQALATQYQQLNPSQRLAVLQRHMAGMSQSERDIFLTETLKSTEEEVGSVGVLMGTGSDAFKAASSAMAGVGPKDRAALMKDLAGYAQGTLGRGQASKDRIALRNLDAVAPEEEIAQNFREESTGRADTILKNWTSLPPEVKSRYSGTTPDQTRGMVYRDDVQAQMEQYWLGLSNEERASNPGLRDLILQVSGTRMGLTYESDVIKVGAAHRAFIRGAQLIAAGRNRGLNKGLATPQERSPEGKARTSQMRAATGSDVSPLELDPGESDTIMSQPGQPLGPPPPVAPGPQSSAGTMLEDMAAAAGVGRASLTVNIGQYVVPGAAGAGGLEGRLDGYTAASA